MDLASYHHGRRTAARTVHWFIKSKQPFTHDLEGIAAQLKVLDQIRDYVEGVMDGDGEPTERA